MIDLHKIIILFLFFSDFGIKTGRQMKEYTCGFSYSSDDAIQGYFSSPNYPGFYPRDTECHYFFRGSNGERVAIEFHYFDVEGVLP